MRNYNLFILGLAAVVLLAAGCLKQTKSEAEAAATNARAKQQATMPPAGDEAPQAGAPQAEPYKVTREDKKTMHDLVVSLAPAYSMIYDAEKDALRGLGMPDAGVPAQKIVDKASENVLKPALKDAKPDLEAPLRLLLSQLQAAAEQSLKGGPKMTTEQPLPAPEQAPQVAETFSFPEDVVGDWQSVRELREENPQFKIEHNDKYYEMMFLNFNGTATFQIFRDGQVLSNTKFPFKYEPKTGKLLLLGPDKKAVETVSIKHKASEPDLIHVAFPNRSSTVVFKKIARGDKPYTEEEKQRLKDMMSGGAAQKPTQPGK